MTTTPQDRKPKADAPFSFKGADGKSYTLPKMTEAAAETLPGEITFNAVMNPDDSMAQMRLALASLEACKPAPKAMTALKSLGTSAMLEVVGSWMGESSGSSD
jgi:hypothetical protein